MQSNVGLINPASMLMYGSNLIAVTLICNKSSELPMLRHINQFLAIDDCSCAASRVSAALESHVPAREHQSKRLPHPVAAANRLHQVTTSMLLSML